MFWKHPVKLDLAHRRTNANCIHQKRQLTIDNQPSLNLEGEAQGQN